MNKSLFFQFCHQTVKLTCTDEELNHALTRYFRYHLVASTPEVAVTYTIFLHQAKWHIQRDDTVTFITAERRYVFAHLAYEVVAYLVNHSPDYLVIHAAGLTQGDKGMIFCAPSGSGKSTLTTGLVAAGWGFYSDDMVAWSPATGDIHGLTIPIVLQNTALFAAEPWFNPTAWPYKLPEVTWLDPLEIRPHDLPPPHRPHALIFPTYMPQVAFEIKALSPAAAVFRLWPRVINAVNWPDKGLALTKQFTQSLPAYQVQYSHLIDLQNGLESLSPLH